MKYQESNRNYPSESDLSDVVQNQNTNREDLGLIKT